MNSRTVSQHSPMHRATHYLEHEDPGIIKRPKEPGITNGESAHLQGKAPCIFGGEPGH